MKRNEKSINDDQENERKENRSKKLADKLGPAHGDRGLQHSKDVKKESYLEQKRENENDSARKEGG